MLQTKELVKLPSLIGLAGAAGSGKSTVASLLVMMGYKEVAFADSLRQEAFDAMLSHEYPEVIDNALRNALSFLNPTAVFAKPTPMFIRELLQKWGYEYRRSQDEDYWVKRLSEKICRRGLLSPGDRYVISDVRFPNEASMVSRLGGVVWKIKRDVTGVTVPLHASESQALVVDAVIDNNGLIGDLAKAVLTQLGKS